MELRVARPDALNWVRGLIRRGDGGGGDVVGPLTVIQTHYSDPVNDNVVLLIWEETVGNPEGVDVFVDDENVGTVTLDLAFLTSLDPGAHVFRVQESGVPDPSFAEGTLTIVETQPFSDAEDLVCVEGSRDENGNCEMVLEWVNPGPLPSYYLIQVDGTDARDHLGGEVTDAILPGLEPGGHSAALIGFLAEAPEKPRSIYRGVFVETECTLFCRPGACEPPSDLRLCQAAFGNDGQNRVRVEWVNGEESYPGGAHVLVDGTPLGKLENRGGDEMVGFVEGLSPGEHTIGIQGDCGSSNGTSSIVEGTIALISQSPHGTPTRGPVFCEFNGEKGTTTATWENATPSEFIDVWVLSPELDLVFLRTLPGDADSVTVSGTTSAEQEIVLQFFASFDGQCYGSDLVRCTSEGKNAFVRGLCDSRESTLNISSPIFGLSFLFLGGELPSCLEACDADGDGGFNITDPVHVLNFLFLGGPAPVGWGDQDGDGSLDLTCDRAPAADCAVSQNICSA